jgi:hypothetical protein
VSDTQKQIQLMHAAADECMSPDQRNLFDQLGFGDKDCDIYARLFRCVLKRAHPDHSGDGSEGVALLERANKALPVLRNLLGTANLAGVEIANGLIEDIGKFLESQAASVPQDGDALESMTRMFHAACADLGAINEALGLDPDDGGAEPIVSAIKRLKEERNQWVDANYAVAAVPQDDEAQTRYVVIGYGETDKPVGAFIQTPGELLDAVLGMIYMHPSDAPADICEAYQKDLANEDEWSEGIWRTEFEIGGIVIYDVGAPLASNKAAPKESTMEFIDVVFAENSGTPNLTFVEVESPSGIGISFGEWVKRDDGYLVLRFNKAAAVALTPEPDCWAILTPNGSRLVSPEEAKGRRDAYPLYTHPAAAQPARMEVLTDAEIDLIANDGMRNAAGGIYSTRVHEFARAIIDASRDKS